MLVNKYDYRHRITPQMRKVVEHVENWKKDNPMRGAWTSAEGIEEYRQWYIEERSWWNEGGPQMEKTDDIWIPGGPHGQINVRLHYPVVKENMPIIVFDHGGGYVCGNNDTHSRIMRILADKSGCCVIGVKVGSLFGNKYQARAELFGGVVLILMGVKILLEHLLG